MPLRCEKCGKTHVASVECQSRGKKRMTTDDTLVYRVKVGGEMVNIPKSEWDAMAKFWLLKDEIEMSLTCINGGDPHAACACLSCQLAAKITQITEGE